MSAPARRRSWHLLDALDILGAQRLPLARQGLVRKGDLKVVVAGSRVPPSTSARGRTDHSARHPLARLILLDLLARRILAFRLFVALVDPVLLGVPERWSRPRGIQLPSERVSLKQTHPASPGWSASARIDMMRSGLVLWRHGAEGQLCATSLLSLGAAAHAPLAQIRDLDGVDKARQGLLHCGVGAGVSAVRFL